jgi:menaquinone-dependent protoporphyrinogen oxidase
MSSRVLVVYGSTHGHTGKIADEIGRVIRETGLHAEVSDVGNLAEDDLERFDAVVIGGSIHAGQHQRELIDWTRLHAGWLEDRPSVFFSVCLTAAEEDAEARETSQQYISNFADATGWQPDRATSFAGALQYREYDFFTRHLMRLMMKRGGHPTDVDQDYDYTDWEAVDGFAREFAEWLTATPVEEA